MLVNIFTTHIELAWLNTILFAMRCCCLSFSLLLLLWTLLQIKKLHIVFDHFAKCVNRSGESVVICSFFIQRFVGMCECAEADEKKIKTWWNYFVPEILVLVYYLAVGTILVYILMARASIHFTPASTVQCAVTIISFAYLSISLSLFLFLFLFGYSLSFRVSSSLHHFRSNFDSTE